MTSIYQNHILKTLKRVHDECEKVQLRDASVTHGVPPIARSFNKNLAFAQKAYPDNPLVQSIKPIESESNKFKMVQSIKMRNYHLIDALDVDIEEYQENPDSNNLNIIEVHQQSHQKSRQEVHQSVTIQDLLEQVNEIDISGSEEEELRSVLKDFVEEVDKEEPDKNTLKQLYEKASTYSVDAAFKLAVYAGQRGIDSIFPG